MIQVNFIPNMAFNGEAHNGAVVAIISGNTYAIKDELKGVSNAWWNNVAKTWDIRLDSADQIDAVLKICDDCEINGVEQAPSYLERFAK